MPPWTRDRAREDAGDGSSGMLRTRPWKPGPPSSSWEHGKGQRGSGGENEGTGQARECGGLLENPRGILWC